MVLTIDSASVRQTSEIDSSQIGLLEALEESLRRGNIDSALGLVDAIRRTVEPPRPVKPPCMYSEFTDREWSTLVLLANPTLSQKDVARSLGITINTLKTHLRSLYQKLGAHSRAEAIELGLLWG
jgi:DNA-binding CsgD family transcriptional regulator